MTRKEREKLVKIYANLIDVQEEGSYDRGLDLLSQIIGVYCPIVYINEDTIEFDNLIESITVEN